jgi:NADH-quinone oxidoreductase subunit E
MLQEVVTCGCVGEHIVPEEQLWLGLDRIISEHRGQPGGLIRVLQKAQDLVGHLPMEVQERIAEGLGVPVSDVYGVVTFYSYFTMEPRGKHVIRVCMGTACYVRGGSEVLAEAKAALGLAETGMTPDGQFSVETVRCVGACSLAPVVMVDEDIYRQVKPREVKQLLARYGHGRRGEESRSRGVGTATAGDGDGRESRIEDRE